MMAMGLPETEDVSGASIQPQRLVASRTTYRLVTELSME
jgi:hypothetical protein